MNWDTLISAVILIVLGLGFWARISNQTIPELFRGIKEALEESREDSYEYAEDVISND